MYRSDCEDFLVFEVRGFTQPPSSSAKKDPRSGCPAENTHSGNTRNTDHDAGSIVGRPNGTSQACLPNSLRGAQLLRV